jgi:RNA polymerase sigma-70 factor (ECF subfamily)
MHRELVERAMAQDGDAFDELARISIRRLYAIARLILRDDAKAEDATQEALVAAWSHIGALRDPDRFDAWLHRLLVRSCYREAGRTSRLGSFEIHARVLEASEPDVSVGLADRDQLERGFLRLDTDQRAVLVLHYYLGLRLDEAAEVLGIPPGTVRSRLHRAIVAMRAALEADARTRLLTEGRPT